MRSITKKIISTLAATSLALIPCHADETKNPTYFEKQTEQLEKIFSDIKELRSKKSKLEELGNNHPVIKKIDAHLDQLLEELTIRVKSRKEKTTKKSERDDYDKSREKLLKEVDAAWEISGQSPSEAARKDQPPRLQKKNRILLEKKMREAWSAANERIEDKQFNTALQYIEKFLIEEQNHDFSKLEIFRIKPTRRIIVRLPSGYTRTFVDPSDLDSIIIGPDGKSHNFQGNPEGVDDPQNGEVLYIDPETDYGTVIKYLNNLKVGLKDQKIIDGSVSMKIIDPNGKVTTQKIDPNATFKSLRALMHTSLTDSGIKKTNGSILGVGPAIRLSEDNKKKSSKPPSQAHPLLKGSVLDPETNDEQRKLIAELREELEKQHQLNRQLLKLLSEKD